MLVSGAARLCMTAKCQETKLMGAVEKVFVGELCWLSHHGCPILP
jgi:hypothetical protein